MSWPKFTKFFSFMVVVVWGQLLYVFFVTLGTNRLIFNDYCLAKSSKKDIYISGTIKSNNILFIV